MKYLKFQIEFSNFSQGKEGKLKNNLAMEELRTGLILNYYFLSLTQTIEEHWKPFFKI